MQDENRKITFPKLKLFFAEYIVVFLFLMVITLDHKWNTTTIIGEIILTIFLLIGLLGTKEISKLQAPTTTSTIPMEYKLSTFFEGKNIALVIYLVGFVSVYNPATWVPGLLMFALIGLHSAYSNEVYISPLLLLYGLHTYRVKTDLKAPNFLLSTMDFNEIRAVQYTGDSVAEKQLTNLVWFAK